MTNHSHNMRAGILTKTPSTAPINLRFYSFKIQRRNGLQISYLLSEDFKPVLFAVVISKIKEKRCIN